MQFEKYLKEKEIFVFGFDDVIYPEKDYLLQVYYLFSEFLAYTEQIDAKEILGFMQTQLQDGNRKDVFDATATKFGIPVKYEENFIRLHANAILPLKLLLFKQVLDLMQEIVSQGKSIYLLVDGLPEQQINKIKQVEWNGLQQHLKVYFVAEFEGRNEAAALAYLIAENNLDIGSMLLIGNHLSEKMHSIDYFSVTKLL